ncbi:hypothetical protein ABID59_000526 [Bradyrhizobium sp. S3.3.6]|uniref:hypothetical protein n=1 Tax=Bradyrhizobium sp. S3.3.6 TaxID=3156429 RepID=UPI003391A86F
MRSTIMPDSTDIPLRMVAGPCSSIPATARELAALRQRGEMNKLLWGSKHPLFETAGTRDAISRVSGALAATSTPQRFIMTIYLAIAGRKF